MPARGCRKCNSEVLESGSMSLSRRRVASGNSYRVAAEHARHPWPSTCTSCRSRCRSVARRRDPSRSRLFPAAASGSLRHRCPPPPRGRCAPRARASAASWPVGTEIPDPQLRSRRRRDHLELRMRKRGRGACPHIDAGHRSKKADLCCRDRERCYRANGRKRVAPPLAALERHGLCQGPGHSPDDLLQSRRAVRAVRHLERRNILADYLRRSRNRIVELGREARWSHYGIAFRRNYTLDHAIPAFDSHTPDDVVPKPRTGTLPFQKLNVAGGEYRTLLINSTLLPPRLVSDLKRSRVRFRRKLFTDVQAFGALRENIVINCTGYGAKQLVQDDQMLARRGPLVVLRRPLANQL